MIRVTADILPEDLRKIRQDNDMTQAQMAEFLGVSIGLIKQYEGGKAVPSFDTIAKMILGFGIGFSMNAENLHPLVSERLSQWMADNYIEHPKAN